MNPLVQHYIYLVWFLNMVWYACIGFMIVFIGTKVVNKIKNRWTPLITAFVLCSLVGYGLISLIGVFR